MSFRASGSGSLFSTPVKSPSNNPNVSLSASNSTPSRFSQPPKPAIPPPKDAYEPQLKWILRRRLVRAVGLCALVALAASATSNASSDRDWIVWSLQVCFRASVWVLGGMIPVVVSRKLGVRASNPPGVTPSFKTFVTSRLKDPHNRTTASLYVLSSLALLSHVMPPAFVPSRRYPFALNPQLVIYICLSILLALCQTLRGCIRLRNVVQWSKYANVSGIHTSFFPNLLANSVQALIANFLVLPFFLISYHLALPIALWILSYLPIHHFLPLLHRSTFSYLPYPFSIPLLIWRTLFATSGVGLFSLLGLIVRDTLIWESANTAVDIYFAMIPRELGSDEKAIVATVSGLSSENEYFSHHAFNHLANLLISSPAARNVIYKDTKHNPNLWNVTLTSCLSDKCLTGDRSELERRGVPPPAPAPAPVVPKTPTPAPGTPIHLLRPSQTQLGIFKPATQSPTQRHLDEVLSSEGSASRVVVGVSERLGSLGGVKSMLFAQSGEVKAIQLASPSRTVASAPAPAQKSNSIGLTSLRNRVGSFIGRLIPGWMYHPEIDKYFNGRREDRIVRSWVRRRELDLRGIEILRHLVAHSLTEDALGTIQRDIPKVLESLCGYLSVVEGARDELGKKIGLDFRIGESEGVESASANAFGGEGGVDTEKREEILRGLAEIEPLRVALQEAVQGISATFGHRLNVFGFTPKTKRRLSTFLGRE